VPLTPSRFAQRRTVPCVSTFMRTARSDCDPRSKPAESSESNLVPHESAHQPLSGSGKLSTRHLRPAPPAADHQLDATLHRGDLPTRQLRRHPPWRSTPDPQKSPPRPALNRPPCRSPFHRGLCFDHWGCRLLLKCDRLIFAITIRGTIVVVRGSGGRVLFNGPRKIADWTLFLCDTSVASTYMPFPIDPLLAVDGGIVRIFCASDSAKGPKAGEATVKIIAYESAPPLWEEADDIMETSWSPTESTLFIMSAYADDLTHIEPLPFGAGSYRLRIEAKRSPWPEVICISLWPGKPAPNLARKITSEIGKALAAEGPYQPG
jgi:hypothetical protein